MIQRKSSASARTHGLGEFTGPVRMCVGCRGRELATELVRVVAVADGNGQYVLIVDTTARLPGRGAWLHREPRCLHEAIRRRAFGRALRITGSPDTSAVVDHVDHIGKENR